MSESSSELMLCRIHGDVKDKSLVIWCRDAPKDGEPPHENLVFEIRSPPSNGIVFPVKMQPYMRKLIHQCA